MLSLHQEFRTLFLGTLIWIILLLVFGPLYLTFYLCSRTVHLIAKIFHPEFIPLTLSDSFVTVAPSYTQFSYMYTCQIWKVKGILDVDAFRNHFYRCFLSTEEDRNKYRNLYCHMVEYLGYVFKKRQNYIDLQWHIHQHQLNEGESLNKFIGSWMLTHNVSPAESPEEERPEWMIKIIHDPLLNETTVVFKLHHGICDGYTIVHLVDKLSGQQSPYMFKEVDPSIPKTIKTVLQCPYELWCQWRRLYLLRKEKKLLVEDVNEEKESSWLISFCTLDLDTVKGIRRVTGTNFVAVLMSIQIGALRRFLKEIRPDARILRSIPSEVNIGHSMGRPNHPVPMNGGGMGNHLTMNLVKSSFHMEDPLERLLDLDTNFRETKTKNFPFLIHYILFSLMKHCPAWFNRFIISLNLSVFYGEVGLSSLLGSPNPHFLLGHQVENIYLPVVTATTFPALQLMNVPVSHSGILDISVNAKTSLVKNQEMLDRLVKEYIVQELESLRVRCQQLVE